MNRTLAPKNPGDILRETFTIYKNNFLKFIAIVAVVLVPYVILYAVAMSLMFASRESGAADQSILTMLVASIVMIIAIIAMAVASVWMIGAVIHAVSEQYFNQPVSIGRAYSFAWRRMGDMFGASVLSGLAIFGIYLAVMLISVAIAAAIGGTYSWLTEFAIAGILFLIALPSILYLGTIWSFVWQTALLEGCGPRAALSHSAALVKGSWWRVLGIVLLLLLIIQVIVMIFYIPAIIGITSITMTGGMSGAETFQTWMGVTMIATMILGFIGYIISIPIYVIGETLLYFDLRVRKQGYSLDALANELGLTSTSNDTVS